MKRQSWIALGITVVVIGAGGVLLDGVPLGSQESTSYLSVTPPDETDSNGTTVAFSELTPAQQSVFRDALRTDDLVEIPDDVERHVWIHNSYVRYRNKTYRVAVAVN